MFFLINFSARRSENKKKSGPRQKILIFKQEVVMKNKVILLTAMFLIGSFLTAQTSFSQPGSFLEQETYLFKKLEADGPWEIILPNPEEEIPYAKLEYLNYPVTVTEGEVEITGFYFDLKGYNIPTDQDGAFLSGPYALIYYPDPWINGGPEVYVFGISGSEAWVSPAMGKAKGHDGVNLKIDGVCDIDQFPFENDQNYPNGAKVWLVPTDLLTTNNGGELEACSLATMTGWNQSEILFESSLITFGFIAEED
jgi:hypothetical protein